MNGDGWNTWAYVVACIAVPAAWGALSVWLFDKLDRRRAPPEGDRPPIDYTI